MKENKIKIKDNSTQYSLKHSTLNKITLHQRNFLSQDRNDDLDLNQNKTSKNKNYFSFRKIFEEPKNLKKGKIWPKITYSKQPFSRIFHESHESKRLKIKLTKPSKTLHEFNTIKWLRKKYSDSVIEKSIHSILPKKNNALIYQKEKEQDKRYRTMLEYLDSFKGPMGREKFIDINPKYLFDETTFKKILKLKEVFLEFDISGNQKMEFDEIVKMFNHNHINAGKNDIINLFFKHKIIKKQKDIMKLHLGFYQFINFALNKEQNFRNFMRKIKSEHKQKETDEYNNSNNKERIYLPMNFNLILDYFIKKEKERHMILKLKNAFDVLENDIKKENENNQKSDNSFYEFSKLHDMVNNLNSNKNNIKYSNLKKSYRNIIKKKQKNNLSDVNIIDLFNEFINLFYLCCKSGENDEKIIDIDRNEINTTSNKYRNLTQPKKIISIDDNSIITESVYNQKNIKINSNTKKNNYFKKYSITEYNSSNKNENSNDNDNEDKLITLIKNQMNKQFINKISFDNFKKYHDINIAKNETLKQIRKEFDLDKKYNQKKGKRKSINILINGDNKNNIKSITPFRLEKSKIK